MLILELQNVHMCVVYVAIKLGDYKFGILKRCQVDWGIEHNPFLKLAFRSTAWFY